MFLKACSIAKSYNCPEDVYRTSSNDVADKVGASRCLIMSGWKNIMNIAIIDEKTIMILVFPNMSIENK